MKLDIAACRQRRPYSRGEQLRRALWGLIQPAFRLSPRPCFGWRRWLLRRFGATIGAQVNIYRKAQIALPWNLRVGDWSSIADDALIYNLGPVTIGARVTISHRAHLCAGTHDLCDPAMPLLRPPIAVGDDAWVCTEAFVGPGVTVGAGAVVGARAVAVRDVPAWTVVAGNPAKAIKPRVLAANPRRHPE